jgi:S1-C subfamily serine protease
MVYENEASDVAFLKICDTTFTSFNNIPYTFSSNSSDLGEYVYTLGFSKQDVVFGEGSISSLTGFNEDSLSIEISIPSNPGNSGGPLLNSKGEIVGMLCAKNYDKEGATYAIKSQLLLSLVDSLNSGIDSKIIVPSRSIISNMERTKQIKKVKSLIFRIEAF